MCPEYCTGKKFAILEAPHGKYLKPSKEPLNATNSLKLLYFLIFADRNFEISERPLKKYGSQIPKIRKVNVNIKDSSACAPKPFRFSKEVDGRLRSVVRNAEMWPCAVHTY